MTALLDTAGASLVLAGTLLATLGTIGLLRFPDVPSRLHALTKADNAGLGLCVVGLALIGRDLPGAVLMIIVWGAVMFSGATAAHLVARRHLARRSRRGD